MILQLAIRYYSLILHLTFFLIRHIDKKYEIVYNQLGTVPLRTNSGCKIGFSPATAVFFVK